MTTGSPHIEPTPADPYRDPRRIASGGMASVWLTEDPRTGRKVALKVPKPHRATDQHILDLFRQEGDILAALDHPGIVELLDRGFLSPAQSERLRWTRSLHAWAPNTPYLAMEYIEGRPLGSFTEEWSFSDLRRALLEVLAALEHAHERGVVHCDIKPGNILVAEGKAVLIDFGVATSVQGDVTPNKGGTVLGTPAYMSPEQVRGDFTKVGPQSDLYSLGCTAWRMATGRRPFAGRAVEVMARHLRGNLPTFDPRIRVPRGFEGWLRHMTELDPGQRFESATAAAEVLQGLKGASDLWSRFHIGDQWGKRRYGVSLPSWLLPAQVPGPPESRPEDSTLLVQSLTH